MQYKITMTKVKIRINYRNYIRTITVIQPLIFRMRRCKGTREFRFVSDDPNTHHTCLPSTSSTTVILFLSHYLDHWLGFVEQALLTLASALRTCQKQGSAFGIQSMCPYFVFSVVVFADDKGVFVVCVLSGSYPSNHTCCIRYGTISV